MHLGRTCSRCLRAASCQAPAVQLPAPAQKSVKLTGVLQLHARILVPSSCAERVCLAAPMFGGRGGPGRFEGGVFRGESYPEVADRP